MRHPLVLVAAVCLFSVVSTARIAAQTRPATPPSAIDAALAAFRADMQANRAEVMAKNLSLTAEQMARFSPVYGAYQREQNAILDEHLEDLQRYVESVDTLDEAGALGLIQAALDRDAKVVALRQKAFGDFRAVLGTKLAVRAIQIDRRLSLAYQLQILTKIPLVH